ncbi:MAG: chromosome segregation protein SMC [Sedimentisphaerales bacterium]|nr:chromosome segregation protein SMC [Sedimentisphaerales bacterium]
MKLEKIVLNGFKSFADKTEFAFNQRITAIVGPNGCGKSNVVDAVKWVLGNQSPKQLRSGQMLDVIFSGSSSRKPSGMAQVSLRFSDVRGLGIEQDDLEITRRLYRSGESEYLINNRVCRLRDIRELFMDTGVGVSAYSIIEQGQIDQLLQASKTDRRVIFEEAAGISKFKAHKKEAARKLERTEQNLLRLADIVAEVQRQLRSIKLQAGKARNYLKYSERLKELRVNYSLSEYDKITCQKSEKKAALGELEGRFGRVAADVARCDAELSQIGSQIIESEGQINRWDNSLVAATSKIEQQMERISFLQNRLKELDQRKATSSAQIRQLGGRTDEFTRQLRCCNQDLEKNETIFTGKREQLEAMDLIVEEINMELDSLQAELEDEKSGIIDIVRRTAQLHNEIQSMNTYRDNLSGQVSRLSDRAATAKQQLSNLLTDKAQYQARLQDINGILGQLQDSLDTKRAEMEAIDGEMAQEADLLNDTKQRRSGLMSELNILRDMEAKREGLNEALKDILCRRNESRSASFEFVEGIVADIIHADAEHAALVEAALEGKADTLVVNSTGAFVHDQDFHDRLNSRVNVICSDRVEPFVETHDLSQYASVLGRVIEFVQYDSKHARLVWNLLGRVIVVESLDTAMDLSRQLGPRYRFVTTDGQVFDGGHTLRIGPLGKSTGLISRRSRIVQLEEETVRLSQQITELENHRKEQTRHTEHLARLCKDFRTSIYEASTEKVDTESRLRMLEQNIQRLTDEQPVLNGEIKMLEEEISQSVQREHDSKQKLQELEQINTQRAAHIEELGQHLEEKKTLLDHQTALRTELKVEIGQFTEQQRSIRQQVASYQSQLQHNRMAIESARTELLGCDEQVSQTERNILSSESRVSELYVEKENAQRISKQLHSEVEHLLAQRKMTEQRLREQRVVQAEVEEQMQQLKIELGQLQVKEEDLTQRVQEELQINLLEAYDNFQQEDVDWELVRKEITELRDRIDRIGNVNLDAIEEQDELEKRFEFLSTQVEDLNTSKIQLEQLIAKINKESREKFRITFEEIRENFHILFRKLFGGGKADIVMENPEDLLESGIEIIARPPGKETRSISLLSGGEKTMTAISLLFAVFKTKPSPFCFLDEVDAALDEANNERFNLVVQEFKKDSQFVIVTHAKRTMSIADMLYGVTMQTKGVSKKISVQFDSAEEPPETAVA